jgi:hypothetical protein
MFIQQFFRNVIHAYAFQIIKKSLGLQGIANNNLWKP